MSFLGDRAGNVTDQVTIVLKLLHIYSITYQFPVMGRAIIEVLPCGEEGIKLQLRDASQICSVHRHGIPV